MSETTTVPFGDNPGETAVLLLAAVEELGLDPHVVQVSDGEFVVPNEVAKKGTKKTAKKTAE